MYSTRTAITMSLKDLLDKLTDYDIYSYYVGQFKIGKLFNSPLRSDDKNPSFAIFKGINGGLFFKDHGSGEGGNAIKFVKLYKNINTKDELERELLRIVRKMNPNSGNAIRTYSYSVDSGLTDIGIVRQPFTDVDKRYWKQFHISIDTLRKFQVFSIKYFLCNRVVRGTYKETSPMYAYKVDDKFKIYRPLASKYTKWRTNLTNRNVQGLSELPVEGGNLLIITKSLKDVMCLYEMGFNAIAASSETTFIPDDILDSLRHKWKNVIILYDRDKTGMLESRKYSKQYKLDALFVHKRFKAKDVSDAVKDNSYNEVKQWLTQTLMKYD
ncbi:DNA primase/helicase [uncultured phage cr131_1]|uniref:DNA primase/helicase n=1 Tax=uncultured phage cr131_1 TaxID=2772093 RepID=A0A7M1RTI2_9CAUD|nr:DNA primase [uncultured phage cr131_1]QOR57757.1 DNA primase/helicase [uncultured phage cr131_1]